MKSFWKNRKVLITGSTGFKGSWLSTLLYTLGAKIYGYSLKQKVDLLHSLLDKNKIFVECVYDDVLKFDKFKKYLIRIKPEIVFHLASQPLVSESYLDPQITYKTNIFGTINLLEICREVKSIKTILIITSDKVYRMDSNKIKNENSKLGGFDPYSSSKSCQDIISKSYYLSFFKNKKIGLSTIRSGNIIGGGDWSKDRIIPDIMNSIFLKKKLILRNHNAIRPWQHVLDPAFGYVLLAEKMYKQPLKFSSEWNFGPYNQKNYTVIKLINFIEKYSNQKLNFSKSLKTSYLETKILRISSKKTFEKIGFKLNINFETSCKLTYDWYCAFYNKNDMHKFTVKQINSYLDLNA